MLRIRRKQMDALDAAARVAFLRRATSAAATWSSLEALSRDALAQWVAERAPRGIALGLDDEPVLIGWLALAADFGDAVAEDAFVVSLVGEPGALGRWEETHAVVASFAAGEAGGAG